MGHWPMSMGRWLLCRKANRALAPLQRIALTFWGAWCGQVLIDPVCMFTIYPQLLRNFIYRLPRMSWGMGLPGIIDAARYLFSRNLIIAEAFGRKFAWHKVLPVHCLRALRQLLAAVALGACAHLLASRHLGP